MQMSPVANVHAAISIHGLRVAHVDEQHASSVRAVKQPNERAVRADPSAAAARRWSGPYDRRTTAPLRSDNLAIPPKGDELTDKPKVKRPSVFARWREKRRDRRARRRPGFESRMRDSRQRSGREPDGH
jgi:hypothetical protein